MPLEMRSLLGQEEADDCPFDPTLRIPPLQYPIPLPTLRRPSPLEPNARVDDGTCHHAPRLDVRTKAPPDAKSIADDELSRQPERYCHTVIERATAPTSFPDVARKRQKLELFHLPKPSTRSSSAKRPSFGSVPVLLNELNEPPPSAALFPPIAINVADGSTLCREHLPQPDLPVDTPDQTVISRQQIQPNPKKDKEGKQKRVYLRGRRPWTTEETLDLLMGVDIYGVGKWKSILHHEGFKFHPDRTSVDLKDRYRTCRLNEERAMDRCAPERVGQKSTTGRSNKSSLGQAAEKEYCNETEKRSAPADRSGQDADTTANVSHEQDFNISTPDDFRGQRLGNNRGKNGSSQLLVEKKHHLPRWTAEEDANLSKGHQKHGFRWTAIAKDPEMGLSHRTGAQVRDRFRLKFPTHYQAAVPLPLPESSKEQQEISLDCRSKLNELKPRVQASSRQELTLILRGSSESPETKPGNSGVQELTERQKPEKASCGNIGPKYTQDPDSRTTLSRPEQRYNDIEPTTTYQSTPPASLTSEDRSRQTSIEGEVYDTRNINIDDLLNSDGDRQSRLPPFKFPFGDNDWGHDAIVDSVTLPPLLWDEELSAAL